ncbi:MAG: hypothetical protein COA45_11465 [Zetaproteobacteria bacterium]|nr:MAG: hypothetical protein COA45_11465 [Zetaproteobacteria bacterium]
MITLQTILSSQSPILDNAKVKLVRHKDSREQYRDVIKDKHALIAYQKEQGKDVFKGCDYIISFIGLEMKRSLFFGVFKVNGVKTSNRKYYYDLEYVSEFDDLVDRLIINWGAAARNWHQWYDMQPKEVVEILPQGYIGSFPGLLNFVLEFDELKRLTNNPTANYEWRNQLSAVNGIYLILDSKTGQQYVGSANGKGGVWQRWSEYAANYTGGNKELIAFIKKDPHYYRHFRYSVLQTLPSNITQREIVAIENLYKDKLGSKAHGLNVN